MKVHLFEPLFRESWFPKFPSLTTLLSAAYVVDRNHPWFSSSLNQHQTENFPCDHWPSHNTYTHQIMPSKISLLFIFSWALNFSVLRQLETSPRRIAEDPEQTPKITDSSPKIRHLGLSNTGDTDFLVGGDVFGRFFGWQGTNFTHLEHPAISNDNTNTLPEIKHLHIITCQDGHLFPGCLSII